MERLLDPLIGRFRQLIIFSPLRAAINIDARPADVIYVCQLRPGGDLNMILTH